MMMKAAIVTFIIATLILTNFYFIQHGAKLKIDSSNQLDSTQKLALEHLELNSNNQITKINKILALAESIRSFQEDNRELVNNVVQEGIKNSISEIRFESRKDKNKPIVDNLPNPILTNAPEYDDPYKCMDCKLKLQPRDHIEIPEAEKNHPLATYSQQRDFPVLISKPNLQDKYPKSTKLIKVLFAIKSICGSHDRRNAVRNTWANSNFNHRHTNYASSLVFLLGACKNEEDQKKLEQEDFYTKDIIQWDLYDSFQNLTRKECLFLQYSKRNLTVVTHIFKGDDDIFVNPIALGLVISKQTDSDDIFLGSSMGRAPRITDINNRYFVPKVLYPHDNYPPYVSGGGYIMSKAITDKLFEASLTNYIFPIDDAFIGVLLETIKKTPGEYHYFRSWGNDFKGNMDDPCYWHEEVLTFHKVTPNEMMKYWSMFIGALGNTCKKGDRGR